MVSDRTKGADEEDVAFGFPAKVEDQKSGFVGEVANEDVAKQEVKAGNNHRLPSSEKKDIPQESLAARISKSRGKG